MPDTRETAAPSVPEVRARLRDAGRMVRDSDTLDPGVRQPLSELIDQLGRALDAPAAPPAEVARLAEGTAHLAESLRRGHDQALSKKARERLEQLILEAEVHAPVAVGLARQVINALGILGI